MNKITDTYWSWYDPGIDKTIIRAHILCDTLSDLPANVDAISGYRLSIGCTADIIDTAARYRMDSSGSWHVQEQGTDFYTKSEIDTMMAAKQNTLTFDPVPVEDSTNPVYSGGVFYPIQQALADLVVDLTGKNRLQNTGVTTTVDGEVTFTVNADGSIDAEPIAPVTANRNFNFVSSLPAGTWHYSTGQALSGVTPAPCFSVINKSGSQLANDFSSQVFTYAEATNFQFRVTIRTSAVVGEIYHFEPMICLPVEYAISPKFIPYQ